MATKKTTPDRPAAASPTRRPAPVRGRASADQPPPSTGATPPHGDVMREVAHDRPAVAASVSPTHDEIAEAAYRRYVDRGGAHGYDADDWFEAERELRRR